MVAVFLLKMNHLRHKFFIIFVVLLALFFYLSATYIATKNNLELNSVEGVMASMKVYGGWLANGFQNTKFLTGNAVKMDWTSTNATFKSNSNNNVKNSNSIVDKQKASVKIRK